MKTTLTFGLVQKASLRKAEAALAKQTAHAIFSVFACENIHNLAEG